MLTKEYNPLNRLTYRFVSNSNRNKLNYEDLSEVCDQTNKLYWSRETRIPWRAICLALFLLVVGTALIVLSILIFTGFIQTIRANDELLVLVFLGLLMFIPGFYHIRIAYYAYYRYQGFDFSDIPDFD